MTRFCLSVGVLALGVGLLVALPGSQAGDKKKDVVEAGESWVQLFNGKDLTGWKMHPDDKAKWEVKDGAIVGTGSAGHLFKIGRAHV